MTPGNAPTISAGASSILIMTAKKAKDKGLKPMASIVSVVASATTPREMAVIPAYTIQKAMKQAGLTLDDMKLIEKMQKRRERP